MNPKQIKMAARIFTAATQAHGDESGAEDDTQAAVLQSARDSAKAALARLGLTPGDVMTLEQCIAASKKLTPSD